jgi:hypothetical protein
MARLNHHHHMAPSFHQFHHMVGQNPAPTPIPTPAPAPAAQQMSFAEIGTLYNTISNELAGGVTPQNKALLLDQVSTVQTQLQGLIDSGTLNGLTSAVPTNPDDPNSPTVMANLALVHAQNIADQMGFLTKQIGTNFGTTEFAPKYINDVVRDVQDIVVGDPALNALAHQGNHSGFQQVSFLLTNPTPFPDTPGQTDRLNAFVQDSNDLATAARGLIGHAKDSPEVQDLIAKIHDFSIAADTYTHTQDGFFQARFNNEFALNGVQGTAAKELIAGLNAGDANIINGAAEVLKGNAADVLTNMLQFKQTFTSMPNGGLPTDTDHASPNFGKPLVVATVHDAGLAFNDAMTKLLGGVYSAAVTDATGTTRTFGNQASIVADLNATHDDLQAAIGKQNITDQATVDHIQTVLNLLTQESGLVSHISTAPPQVSDVNGQIGSLQSQILSIINNDTTLATLAAGADGATGFAALPPSTPMMNQVQVAANTAPAVPAATPAVPAAQPATAAQADVSVDHHSHVHTHVAHEAHFHHMWG